MPIASTDEQLALRVSIGTRATRVPSIDYLTGLVSMIAERLPRPLCEEAR